MKTALTLFLFVLLFAASSCSMQRRQHRPGFYVDRPWLQTTSPAETGISPMKEAVPQETVAEKEAQALVIIAAPEEETKEENRSAAIEVKARGKKATATSPAQEVNATDAAAEKNAAPFKKTRQGETAGKSGAAVIASISLLLSIAAPLLFYGGLLSMNAALIYMGLGLPFVALALAIIARVMIRSVEGENKSRSLVQAALVLSVVEVAILAFFIALLFTLTA